MKTSELVAKLKSMGYQVKVNSKLPAETVFVYTPDGKYAGHVCTKVFGTLSTDTWVTTSGKLCYDPGDIKSLVEALTTYALTPVDKRENTKEYVVKMLPIGYYYINQDKHDKYIIYSSKDETGRYKTHFTEKEYRELQSKYPQWLPTFDTKDPHFVEVQDDKNSEPMTKLHDSELGFSDDDFTRKY